MRILVTGASGYVGSHLVPTLLQAGHRVIAWGGPRWQPPLSSPNLETYAVDLERWVVPLEAVERLDSVIWLAQGNGYKDFPDQAVPLVAINVLALTRALDLARRAGARSFVYASTGNVYGASFQPLTETSLLLPGELYSRTKRAGEDLVLCYERWLAGVIVRIFGVYGPGQHNRLLPNLLTRIINQQTISLEPAVAGEPDDGLRWTPCHVSDVADVLTRLVSATGTHTLNLAAPEIVGIGEVANRAARLLRMRLSFEHSTRTRQGDLIADIARLQSLLPDKRFVRFADGLAETVKAFSKQLRLPLSA